MWTCWSVRARSRAALVFAASKSGTIGSGVTTTLLPPWLGRGMYRPGWRWSEHVQPTSGRSSDAQAGFVISGAIVVQSVDGVEVTVRAGQAWFAAPDHNAWVIGSEPCLALDLPTD